MTLVQTLSLDEIRVGSTPLQRFACLEPSPGTRIFAKLEWMQFGGSVKARPAMAILRDAMASGAWRPGMRLVDATSGNTGIGETLSGRLFLFDAATFTTRTVKVRKSPKNPLTGDEPTQTELVNYEAFCNVGVAAQTTESPVREITPTELQAWRNEGRAHLLVDVREPYEYGIAEMGGELIPLHSVEESQHRIPKDRPVVLHCRSGVRSARALRALEALGYTNLYSLEGGILAWQEQIQPELARY